MDFGNPWEWLLLICVFGLGFSLGGLVRAAQMRRRRLRFSHGAVILEGEITPTEAANIRAAWEAANK